MNSTRVSILLASILLSSAVIACSAIQANPGANAVQLISEQPAPSRCRYIGEAIGSQGNWFTGDFTSNKNLMAGARNDLRNQAYEMGGNTVEIQNVNNSSAFGSLGTTNSAVVGKVYSCR